ncbi:hypothetical protein AHAS_Ahas07G0086500 [Arachis hypogaea]
MAEKCLRVLTVVATCADGKTTMNKDILCAAVVVKGLAKAGKAANEDAMAVLWILYCLCSNEKMRDKQNQNSGTVMQGSLEEVCLDLIMVIEKILPHTMQCNY